MASEWARKRRGTWWRCECGWSGSETALLRGASPWGGQEVVGCPGCRGVAAEVKMVALCDVSGCLEECAAGWPQGKVYRRTCSRHYKPAAE